MLLHAFEGASGGSSNELDGLLKPLWCLVLLGLSQDRPGGSWAIIRSGFVVEIFPDVLRI